MADGSSGAPAGGDAGGSGRAQRRRKRKKTRLIWTLDAETDPFHHCADEECAKCHGGGRVPQPFIWGAYQGDEEIYLEFNTAAEVAEHFAPQKALVYAHNGGKFDYHYLRDFMNTDEAIMNINGRMARFRIGESEFRDSLNIFPNTRLADFGVKNEIDYALMEPDRRDDPNIKAQISSYLRQDCKGLWDVVTRYRERFGKSLTQATASMKYWEKMHGIEAPRQSRTQHERYKPYYYGGRVQCFESGVAAVDFKVADLNSAYPRAMLEEHMFSPEAIVDRHLPPDPEIYRCLVKLDCTSRGALPWRDPETGELFFPDDEAGNRNRMRTYSVTGWELMAALELDAIANIHLREVHTFTKTQNFKEYIEHFYNERMEAAARGDAAGKIFGKYFMNSLYGKFGANCANYAEYVLASDDTLQQWEAGGYKQYKPWGDRFLLERKPTEEELDDITGKWRYYNVATAASVTGYVRANLFRAMSHCSGLIYCDTDSISARDVSRLDFGGQLGQWKDEGRYDRYAIAGKKLYAFHAAGREEVYDPKQKEPSWKVASKGTNFHARPEGPEMIIRAAQGETILHRPEAPTYSITRGEPVFINRKIRGTYKDMSFAPETELAPISQN